MKLSLAREQLLTPLQSVIGAVERKTPMAILECLLLEAEGDTLTFTATNLEMQMLARMDLATKAGGLCVHARKLCEILRALPEKATVDLTHSDSRLTVKSGRSRFSLATLPAANFPAFAIDGEAQGFSVDGASLRRALEKAASAQARDDVRYYLNGACLRLAGEELRVVASDGHRLVWCDVALHDFLDNPKDFILPRRSVLELLKLLPDEPEHSIECRLHPHTFTTELPGLSFSTKLLEGKFPDENRVIPHGFEAEFTLERDTLAGLVNRAVILADEKFRGIKLELKNGTLRLYASNTEQEQSEDEMAVDCKADVEAGYNATYLLDALRHIDSKTVRIRVDDKQVTLLQDADSDAYGLIVMPLRT